MHRTFEEWKKLDNPEFWSNNIDELRKANEDRFFVKRHEEYLAKRTFVRSNNSIDSLVLSNITKRLSKGIPAFELFVLVGLCSHSSDAIRVIKQGGARVNGVKVRKHDQFISNKDAIVGEIKLSRGKKKKFRILTQNESGG